MLSARLTHAAVRSLDWLAGRFLPRDKRSAHLRTGSRGEQDAYFHLRKLGYIIVARNYRTPRRRGEIDLIGWDGDVLCFIEVKTRTSRDVKTPEAAVDRISGAKWPPWHESTSAVYHRRASGGSIS